MKTIESNTVAPSDLNDLAAFVATLPPDSGLAAALSTVVDDVRGGADVIVAPANEHLTPAAAAKLLGMSRTHLYKLMDAGEISHVRVGRDRRVSLRELLEFSRRQDDARRGLAERFAHSGHDRAALLDRLADQSE